MTNGQAVGSFGLTDIVPVVIGGLPQPHTGQPMIGVVVGVDMVPVAIGGLPHPHAGQTRINVDVDVGKMVAPEHPKSELSSMRVVLPA